MSAGIARRTDLGADRLYYEVARTHRHHHAVCQRCRAVVHLHDATLEPLAGALREETGFVLTPDREIAIQASARPVRPRSADPLRRRAGVPGPMMSAELVAEGLSCRYGA